jgi:hypothetical protein
MRKATSKTGGYISYLKTLPLLQALWWYIENVSSDDPDQATYFFYLRERYRKEEQAK